MITFTGWETPQDFFDTLNEEFHFTCDVCADQENHKIMNYYNIQDDGLHRQWEGVCWCNPPYNKYIGLWIKKAWESTKNGVITVCLIQGRSTDTKWWHDYVMKASELRFIKDRLHFGKYGRFNRANISSVIVIFKPNHLGYPVIKSINTKGIEIN
jgi:phage N-6-adenine-methyltransferase